MADNPPPTEPSPPKAAPPKAAPPRNPVFKMMGLPALPRRLPSRNWLIFWALSSSLAAALIHDRREKTRATAKWRRAVSPLALEPMPHPSQLPRKLTIFLEAPPGDGLRAAQDHFLEYAKPVLAAAGFDWEFVQGREEGDVRAAVAERIRRGRAKRERPGEEGLRGRTEDDVLEGIREGMGMRGWEGVNGDLVVGRHTWKEYVRGLHEGWLGPLDPPAREAPLHDAKEKETQTQTQTPEDAKPESETGEEKKDGSEEEAAESSKPSRPPQPPPHNATADYASALVPAHIPDSFAPSLPIAFPHRLGFRHTFVRLGRFFNRRRLADDIGRDVAAVCFAAARDWRADEQQLALQQEEDDWPKSTWDTTPSTAAKDEDSKQDKKEEKEKERIWASPMVIDARIGSRMRRFEMTPEDEARAAAVVVPEEEVEGWIKGSLRGFGRWGVGLFEKPPSGPNVGNVD